MFAILMLIAAVTIMYKVADFEKRNAFLWASVTLVVCVGCMFLLPWPFLNIAAGLVLCFGTMCGLKMLGK